MALKSNREGLRKESVDYLGNIIIDKKLKQDIVKSIDDEFVNETDVLSLEEIKASSDLNGKTVEASALKINRITSSFVADNVTEYSFYRSGDIVYGRINITYVSNTQIILKLPAPLERGFFPVFSWTTGIPIDGSVFIDASGSCYFYGYSFTGTLSCILTYICS